MIMQGLFICYNTLHIQILLTLLKATEYFASIVKLFWGKSKFTKIMKYQNPTKLTPLRRYLKQLN